MEAKHTPGPWDVHYTDTGAEIHPLSDEDGLTLIADLPANECPNREADARLIAAAPDLLGFARLVAALEDKCRSEGGRHPTYAEWAVLATSIPAIARATGGGA